MHILFRVVTNIRISVTPVAETPAVEAVETVAPLEPVSVFFFTPFSANITDSYYRRRKRRASSHVVCRRVLVTFLRSLNPRSLPPPRSMNSLPRLMNLFLSPLLRTRLLELQKPLLSPQRLPSPLSLLSQPPQLWLL